MARGRPAPGQGRQPVSCAGGRLSFRAALASAESGCPVAALASEIPRQSPEVRAAAAQRVRSLMARVQAALPGNAAPDSVAVIASQLVGALQLARALGDNAEGKALLAAARRNLLAHHDGAAAAPAARAARRPS